MAKVPKGMNYFVLINQIHKQIIQANSLFIQLAFRSFWCSGCASMNFSQNVAYNL